MMKKLLTLITLVVFIAMSGCEEDSLTIEPENLKVGDKYLDGYVIDNNDKLAGITIMKLQDEGIFFPDSVLAQEDEVWSVPNNTECFCMLEMVYMDLDRKLFNLFPLQTEIPDDQALYYYLKLIIIDDDGNEKVVVAKRKRLRNQDYDTPLRSYDKHRLRLVRTIN